MPPIFEAISAASSPIYFGMEARAFKSSHVWKLSEEEPENNFPSLSDA